LTIQSAIVEGSGSRKKKDAGEEGKGSVVPARDIHKSFSMRCRREARD
jgi:hypothetical protein